MNRIKKTINRIFGHTEPEKPMSEFMTTFGNFRLASHIAIRCIDDKIIELNRTLNLAHICLENIFSGNTEIIMRELIKLESDILKGEKG